MNLLKDSYGTQAAFITKRLTSVLQPLDVVVNAPFKSYLREESGMLGLRMRVRLCIPEVAIVSRRRIRKLFVWLALLEEIVRRDGEKCVLCLWNCQ